MECGRGEVPSVPSDEQEKQGQGQSVEGVCVGLHPVWGVRRPGLQQGASQGQGRLQHRALGQDAGAGDSGFVLQNMIAFVAFSDDLHNRFS